MPSLGKYLAAYPASNLKENLWCMATRFSWPQCTDTFSVLIGKESLMPFATYFPPGFPFHCSVRVALTFNTLSYTRPIKLFPPGAILNLKKNWENISSTELSQPCVHGKTLYSCAVKIMVFACFFFFFSSWDAHSKECIAAKRVSSHSSLEITAS